MSFEESSAELDGENPWRDVYANYRQFDFFQVQGGKFKLPSWWTPIPGRDEPRAWCFLARLPPEAFRAHLNSRRDPPQPAGQPDACAVEREPCSTTTAQTPGTTNLERVAGERTVAARPVLQPFRASKTVAADMQVGAAFTSSDVPLGRRSLRGQTTFEETFFDPDLWVQGTRRRTGFELRWRPGPFSMTNPGSPAALTQRLGQSVEDTALPARRSWQPAGPSAARWAVTGEKKSNGLSSPRRPLLRGGVGAVEVALRFEMLRFGSGSTDGTPSSSVRAGSR